MLLILAVTDLLVVGGTIVFICRRLSKVDDSRGIVNKS